MDRIGKIVYDNLASGNGIYLPEIGSLYIERDAARFVSGKEIKPPHNRVVFSRREIPQLESVTDALVRVSEMSPEEAQSGYSEWLGVIRGENEVVEINGVGVIKNNFFYPSVELHDKLNPLGGGKVTVRRKGGAGKFVVIALVALVAAAGIIYAVFPGTFSGRGKATENRVSESVARTPESEAIRDMVAEERATQKGEETTTGEEATPDPSSAPKQSSAPKGEEKPAKEPAVQQKAAPVSAAPAQTARPSGTTYHLVVGVFSVRSNADKCVREDPLGIGSANYKIYPYKGDRFLVSGFQSADKTKADARQAELKARKSDIWIYTMK